MVSWYMRTLYTISQTNDIDSDTEWGEQKPRNVRIVSAIVVYLWCFKLKMPSANAHTRWKNTTHVRYGLENCWTNVETGLSLGTIVSRYTKIVHILRKLPIILRCINDNTQTADVGHCVLSMVYHSRSHCHGCKVPKQLVNLDSTDKLFQCSGSASAT